MAAGALILRHNASDSKHTILGLWLTLRRLLVWTQILLFAVVLQTSPHAFPYVHHVQWQTRNCFSFHRACNGRGQPCPRIVKLHACLCYFVLRLFVGCAVTHGCKPWSYRRDTHRQVSVPAPAVGMPTASPSFYLFPCGSIDSFFAPRTCSFAVAYGARSRPFYFKISHLPLVSIFPSPTSTTTTTTTTTTIKGPSSIHVARIGVLSYLCNIFALPQVSAPLPQHVVCSFRHEQSG
jgi:hypothetical protein